MFSRLLKESKEERFEDSVHLNIPFWGRLNSDLWFSFPLNASKGVSGGRAAWTMVCVQALFFRSLPLAWDSCFALASLSPLSVKNTLKNYTWSACYLDKGSWYQYFIDTEACSLKRRNGTDLRSISLQNRKRGNNLEQTNSAIGK